MLSNFYVIPLKTKVVQRSVATNLLTFFYNMHMYEVDISNIALFLPFRTTKKFLICTGTRVRARLHLGRSCQRTGYASSAHLPQSLE